MLGARSWSEPGRRSSTDLSFQCSDSNSKSIDGFPERFDLSLMLLGKSKHVIPRGAWLTTRIASLSLLLLALLALLLDLLLLSHLLAHDACMVSLPAVGTEGPAALVGMVVEAAEGARNLTPHAEPSATFTAAKTTASATISATTSTTTSTTIEASKAHSDTNTR